MMLGSIKGGGLNSSGGRIFIGITDGSKIKGIQITNKLRSQIQDIVNNCRPKIKIQIEEFDNILIIINSLKIVCSLIYKIPPNLPFTKGGIKPLFGKEG